MPSSTYAAAEIGRWSGWSIRSPSRARAIPAPSTASMRLCTRYGIDRSQRVKHGALLDAQLLAQVYVELTGGRQIGLALGRRPCGESAGGAHSRGASQR